MIEKPTYEALEKRVQELEQAEFERSKILMERDNLLSALLESEKNLSTTLNSMKSGFASL